VLRATERDCQPDPEPGEESRLVVVGI